MSNTIPTESELLLINTLRKRGLEVISQYWDGYKHVDIYVPEARLYIEVDGMQHLTEVK